MIRAWIYSLGFYMLFISAAVAAEPLVQQIKTKYASVNALQADFVQVTSSEMMGKETQKGSLQMKRPKKMRWVFTGSTSREFISNGQTLWIYNKADQQVLRYKQLSNASSTADSLLSSLDQLDQVFSVRILSSSSTEHRLELVPKADDQIQKVYLTLDGQLLLKQLLLIDSFGNETTLSFKNVKLNPKLDNQVFEFKVPAGVEVMDAG